MMMLSESMIQGVSADAKGQQNHPGLESHIMNDIDAKEWQNSNK